LLNTIWHIYISSPVSGSLYVSAHSLMASGFCPD